MGCAQSTRGERNIANSAQWKHANSEPTRRAIGKLIARAEESESQRNSSTQDPQAQSGFYLVRLAYSSVLISDPEQETTDPTAITQELSNIAIKAMRKNAELLIGGVLWYDETALAVVHVLEGPLPAVTALFEQIKYDRRHTAVRKLWQAPAFERKYSGYGLKLEAVHRSTDSSIKGGAAGDAPDDEAETSVAIAPASGEELVRLTYTSVLCARGETAYRLVQQILSVAITNNPKLKIGGVLMMNYATSSVLQARPAPPSPYARPV